MKALPDGTLALAKTDSANAKIGVASTTYAAQASCPSTCPFLDGGGCYAESGGLGKFVTEPLNRAAGDASPLEVAVAEARAIDAMEVVSGRPLRLHTVGDCATEEAARIVSAAAERYMNRGGGPVWTYTHAWRTVPRAPWGRVSVLASCETPDDVRVATVRGYAAALVVDEFVDRKRYELDGIGVVPCPAQTRHDITCTDCRLCFRDGSPPLLGRRSHNAIGFAVHGTALIQKKARLALVAPDDPERRLTSRDHAHELRTRLGRWPTVRELSDRAGVSKSSAHEMLNRLREEVAA